MPEVLSRSAGHYVCTLPTLVIPDRRTIQPRQNGRRALPVRHRDISRLVSDEDSLVRSLISSLSGSLCGRLFGLTILVFALLGQAVTGDMVSGSRVSHARLAQYSSAFPICHAGEPGRPDRRQSPPHRSCAICPFCFANAQLATLPPPQGHQFAVRVRVADITLPPRAHAPPARRHSEIYPTGPPFLI